MGKDFRYHSLASLYMGGLWDLVLQYPGPLPSQERRKEGSAFCEQQED